MRVPFGKKGLMAAGAAITGGVFFWRVRARRREEAEAREWEAEIAGAVDEGRAATAAGNASEPSSEPSTA
ncbi:MAG TPA: hypothetical protein VIM76_10240 [Candidatus Dormibacteraeota bacterium]|jgi:hypothetical protein